MSTANYREPVGVLRSSLDARPNARSHPVPRPRKEVSLPGPPRFAKWLLIATVPVPVGLAVLGAVDTAWALPVLLLSYLALGIGSLAVLRWRRSRLDVGAECEHSELP